MRSASSYRGARKEAAKSVGIPLAKYNAAFAVAARAAESVPAPEAQDAARKKLALWAANGGRETAISAPMPAEALDRLNQSHRNAPDVGPVAEPTVPRITVEDVDKALEAALSGWQSTGQEGPLPLSKLFAARARQLLWVEGVEFEEEK